MNRKIVNCKEFYKNLIMSETLLPSQKYYIEPSTIAFHPLTSFLHLYSCKRLTKTRTFAPDFKIM